MGLLLAIYRKLSLRRKIDQGQYRLMQISSRLQRLESQIGDMQQAKTRAQSVWDMAIGNVTNMTDSIFQSKMATIGQGDPALFKQMQDAIANKDKDPAAATAATNAYEQSANQASQNSYKLAAAYNIFQQQTAMARSTMQNMLDKADESTLQQLHQEDTSLDQQKTSLEAQLASWNAEYESVGKLVESEAKEAAPKFGLS